MTDADTKQEFLLTIGPGGPAMHRLVEEELLDLAGCVPERFGQARFYFSADVEPVERFFRLRSPEKLYALVLCVNAEDLSWPAEQEASEAFLAQRVAASFGWSRALETCRSFGRQMPPSTFRVTAKRAGRRAAHLSSNGIAEFVGEALAEAMDWQVDLHDYDLEVVVHLNDDHLIVGLPLLERSGQQAQFALPGLSQPVAWAMARTVEPLCGEVVIDPMCGSGIVLFEAAQCWQGAYYLGFDQDRQQLERSTSNLKLLAADVAQSLSFARGDARALPLETSSVDAILCDLPFGKQYGSEEDNLALYPAVLLEFRRVLRRTGRAVLLTNQANAKTLMEAMAESWRVVCQRKVLLGHMEALLFLVKPLESGGYGGPQAAGSRLPWEDVFGRRQWSAMKATMRQPLRLVHAGGCKQRRDQKIHGNEELEPAIPTAGLEGSYAPSGWKAEPMSQVLQALQTTQGQLKLLFKRLGMLQEEHEALCECLAAHGAVPAERLMAWLHRRRFAEARRRHPLTSGRKGSKELSLDLAARLGLDAVAQLSGASRAMRASLSALGPDLATLYPFRLYAIGGEACGDALASVERFDLTANTWQRLEPLHTPRSGCAAVALGGYIYAVGGCGIDGEDLRSVERLNLQDELWEEVPPMVTGRDELAVVASGGCIYAMGGSHLVWPVRHVLDSAERFDPRLGRWQELPRLSRERCAAAAVTTQRQIFVMGGCDEDGVALASTEMLDLRHDRPHWEVLPLMRRARCNFAAAVSSGLIIVAGGYDDKTRDVDIVEQLDPSLGIGWEAVSFLPVPRWGVRAASRAGAIFIVGGYFVDNEVGTTDCLDTSGAWASYALLREPRRSFGLAAINGYG
ncbi:unnamed protein product [Cladocopium goreaui]|uniref:Actin-binding protein IPP n=1 Tax=Cladocopium goreaui TaxID=2562237 RepID=A0A9P1BWB5_9DINO|nr:unnamed protein product [Cladocopium goreaui]